MIDRMDLAVPVNGEYRFSKEWLIPVHVPTQTIGSITRARLAGRRIFLKRTSS